MADTPFRILILNSARRWIGEAAHTLALAEGLRGRGHTVCLGARRGFELETRARASGLRVFPLEFSSRFNPIHDARDILRIRRIIRREEINVVHCHRGKDHWLCAAACLLLTRRVALIRTRHVVTAVRPHVFNRWLYGRATDGVIAVSKAAQNSLGRLASRLSPPCVRLIYSAVDANVFSPTRRGTDVRRRLGADDETVLVGLIGRIQRVKGQRDFLRAAAAVAQKRPNARFLLAGRGSVNQVKALWEFADTVGLPRERLRVEGILADLPDVMASLDIGVVASVGSEGSSRVILEYLASGCPVVATRVGGIPDLVRDGHEGFLVEPRDPTDMAARLDRLIQDPALRRAMAEAGRRAALERFTPERWIGEVESLYRETTAEI